MPQIIIAIIASYLIGSIPTAFIFGKILKGIDIRKFGSGNVGATNALRVLGKRAGVTVLLLDVLKGLLPVVFIGDYLIANNPNFSSTLLRIILGVTCICGHNWTIFLRFKGGKGVATTLGVLLALSMRIILLGKVMGIIVLIWFAIFFLSRMVSLASIVSGVCFPVLILMFRGGKTLLLFGLLIAVFIVIRHRSNLTRIIKGKESKLYFSSKKPS